MQSSIQIIIQILWPAPRSSLSVLCVRSKRNSEHTPSSLGCLPRSSLRVAAPSLFDRGHSWSPWYVLVNVILSVFVGSVISSGRLSPWCEIRHQMWYSWRQHSWSEHLPNAWLQFLYSPCEQMRKHYLHENVIWYTRHTKAWAVPWSAYSADKAQRILKYQLLSFCFAPKSVQRKQIFYAEQLTSLPEDGTANLNIWSDISRKGSMPGDNRPRHTVLPPSGDQMH